MTAPALSLVAVVVPLYNEEAVLPELLRRLRAVFDARTDVAWTVVFVDDGSRDRSAAIVAAEAAADPRLRLVRLARNFGHQAAVAAGLSEAASLNARAAALMDGDLQDPPEILPRLVDAWLAGAQVVVAQRRSRSEKGMRRFGMDLFHRAFQGLSDLRITPDAGTFGLLDSEPLAHLNALPERHRFFPGLRAWVGFDQAIVQYDREARAAGKPGQTLRRLARYALDAVFSFSRVPLRVMTVAGITVSGVGFVLGVFYAARRIFGVETAQTGFTTLVTLVLFLGGVQLIAIGILGEYLGRIYDEVKARPLFIRRRQQEPRQ